MPIAFRTAADRGHHRFGQAPFDRLELLARLLADHLLQFAHHRGIGVGTGHGADQKVGRLDIGDPVAHRLVHRVLERAGAGLDRPDLGAEQAHAEHVGLLPLDVDRAHVDHARQAEERADRRRRHAMRAGPGFGDDPRPAHAPGEQDLAHDIVELVRAGMIELFALR